MTQIAYLALKDGSIFKSPDIAAFGHQAMLSDPSYLRSMLTLTRSYIVNTCVAISVLGLRLRAERYLDAEPGSDNLKYFYKFYDAYANDRLYKGVDRSFT